MLRIPRSTKEKCSVLPYIQHTQSDWERFPGLDVSLQPTGACWNSVFLQGIGCPRQSW